MRNIYSILRDGRLVKVRKLTRLDRRILTTFFSELDRETIMARFLSTRIDAERYVSGMFEKEGIIIGAFSNGELIGVAEAYVAGDEAEIAVVVKRGWRGAGLGTLLVRKLVEELRGRVKVVKAYTRSDNRPVYRIARKLNASIIPLDYGTIMVLGELARLF